MNFRQLKCFSLSAELHSFSLASERLYISQSAVTQQIKTLENEVGCQLFHRSNRGITLTEEGEKLLKAADQILQIWDNAVQQLNTHCLDESLCIGYLGPPANGYICLAFQTAAQPKPKSPYHLYPFFTFRSSRSNQLRKSRFNLWRKPFSLAKARDPFRVPVSGTALSGPIGRSPTGESSFSFSGRYERRNFRTSIPTPVD